MSEERFDRIEDWQGKADARFDRIEDWQGKADARFDRIEGWQANADARFDRVEDWQAKADARFDRIDAKFDRVDAKFEELARHMRVLHEDVIDRISVIGGYTGPTREEFAAFQEKVDLRFDRLEATLPLVREHELAIRDHDARLEVLERDRR